MRIKSIELTNFKRFSHLVVEEIPETTKLVVMVGPNGSGKTSFFEAMNHFYKYSGYSDLGDYRYLCKEGNKTDFNPNTWPLDSPKMVSIDFYDGSYPNHPGRSEIRGHFYFRSAYRNEPDFSINTMKKQGNPADGVRLSMLILNDQTVSDNYQRLVANTISEVYDGESDTKTVVELREELIGKVREAIGRVFEDLSLSSIGNPLTNGNFYFTKGITENFSYKNLSAGEKAAFDLVLDMAIQSKYYPDAVYCIDEPEAHMHTNLQGKVLKELFELVPGDSQLWISTHSIGMLKEAEQIEEENPGTVAFLDFGGRDYDNEQIIRPARMGKALLEKFYELTFGDFAKLILPKTVVFCEGDSKGESRKDFDKTVYTNIFSDKHPDVLFISGGSCNDIVKIEAEHGEIIKSLLSNSKVIKIVDKDDRSKQEIEELKAKGIKTLRRRNIEAYLLDDAVIKKLCSTVGKEDLYEECLKDKKEAIEDSVSRGNPSDDLKSASGVFYNSLKRKLELKACGNKADTFMRDTLAPLITPDMDIYRELEEDIFGE